MDTIYVGRQPGLRYILARAVGLREITHRRRQRQIYVRARHWEGTLRGGYLSAFTTGVALCDFGPDSDYDHRYSLNIKLPGLNLFLHLPRWFWRDRVLTEQGFDMDNAGIELQSVDTEFPSELVISRFGRSGIYIPMPWALSHHRSSRLRADGTWYHEYERDRLGVHRARLARRNRWRALVGLPAVQDPRAGETWHSVDERRHSQDLLTETHPYTYLMKSGVVQERVATITVSEGEWRRRWLTWTPLLALVRKSIDVQFSEGVGERVDSWKGGCIGCSYEMRPGEAPLDTLRRMERDRKF